MLILNLNKKTDFVIIFNAISIVRMAAGLAPLSVGDFVLIAERAKRVKPTLPTTEMLTVVRTGEERHTLTFGWGEGQNFEK